MNKTHKFKKRATNPIAGVRSLAGAVDPSPKNKLNNLTTTTTTTTTTSNNKTTISPLCIGVRPLAGAVDPSPSSYRLNWTNKETHKSIYIYLSISLSIYTYIYTNKQYIYIYVYIYTRNIHIAHFQSGSFLIMLIGVLPLADAVDPTPNNYI